MIKLKRLALVSAMLTSTSIVALDREWRGDWEGRCTGSVDIGINIEIGQGRNAFDYILTYGGTPSRNYTFKTTTNPNIYVLDENNGILIHNFLIDNCLLDSFTIQGTRVSTKTCLENNGELTFDVTSLRETPYSTSGNGALQDFEVFSRYLCRLNKTN